MLDFITVVFRDELPLLRIQAESFNQYISPTDVAQITVVVNDDDSVAGEIDPAWWGQHQARVVIKPYSNYNYVSRVTGWESQQLLKLLASAESASEWSMVLDAKTWFVRGISVTDIFDAGRPCVGLSGISPYFESSQKFVENYYIISMPNIIGPAGVPFIFHTATVKEMINNIDNFVDFFQTKLRYPVLITEFHLYSGFVIKKYGSIDALYNVDKVRILSTNIADWEAQQFDTIFAGIVNNPNLLTASIHRRSYKILKHTQLIAWANFLLERKLICNISNTINLLNTYIK